MSRNAIDWVQPNVGEPGRERAVMRSYHPRSRSLSEPAFEKRGCRRK